MTTSAVQQRAFRAGVAGYIRTSLTAERLSHLPAVERVITGRATPRDEINGVVLAGAAIEVGYWARRVRDRSAGAYSLAELARHLDIAPSTLRTLIGLAVLDEEHALEPGVDERGIGLAECLRRMKGASGGGMGVANG